MKVVFVEEVEGTAHVGEIKDVKNGFARNYLLPRNLAVPATKHNLQRAEKLTKVDAVRQDKLDSAAQGIADKLQGAHVTLTARVGQQGRLFGSVTATDIASKLNEETGSDIEHRQVLLSQVIRTLGTQELRVRLTRNVFADVTVTVESEDGTGELTIAEAVEAVEAEEAADAAQAVAEGEAEEASDDADGSETASE